MDPTMEDAPETPAHVFAYRAFRTALFGTPAPMQVDGLLTGEGKAEEPQKIELIDQLEQPATKLANPDNKTFPTSPIKSILLTPGTIGQQRKTVTFSSLRDDATAGNRGGAREVKRLSQKPSFEDITKPKDALRRSLFQSPSDNQPQKIITETNVQMPADKAVQTALAVPSSSPRVSNDPPPFAENTMDLKSPKSHSGKHWKNEYQREHDRTKAEMKRLIRYSQVAKSFAAKRDAEASRMREKLDDADRKVKELEAKVTEMASEIGSVRLEDESRSQIVEDLAVQTAAALKYKQKAERYRAVLGTEKNLPAIDSEVSTGNRPQGEASAVAATAMDPEHVAALEVENESLRSTIARVKEEMRKYEERHHSWQENRRRRDERWAAKRKELEDQLAESREEAEQLRHELRDARLSSSSQPSHSTPLTSQDSVEPSDQQLPHLQTAARATQAVRGAQSSQPQGAQTSTMGGGALKPPATARLESLRRQPESTKSPRPRSFAAESLNIAQQDETLDLWGLAATSGNMSRKPNLGLLSSTSQRPEKPLNAAPEDPHTTDGSLWDNLRRRTSMSLMSNIVDVKPDPPKSLPKADKENVNPAILR